MQFSITIIALDAEKFLPKCLDSVRSLTSDIIVVIDNRTTDDTESVARKFGAKVFIRHFVDFSDQHNFADSKTRLNWTFSLDADEIVSSKLAEELAALPDNPSYSAFWVPRKNKIFGRLINYSNWDPDGIIRLYDKSRNLWEGKVHEQIKTIGKTGKLTGVIYHDNYRTVSEFLSRQNTYSSAEAENLQKTNQKFNIFSAIWAAIYDFCRRFVWHGGWLDGWHGLYLAYLMAVYHISVWVKLWQKQNQITV